MNEKAARTLALRDHFDGSESFLPWLVGDDLRLTSPFDVWGSGRGFAPAIDVSENDKRYLVTLELPGVKKKDVRVEIDDGMLTIRGEKRSERETKDEHLRSVERKFGSFSRSFSLPVNADRDRVKARFRKGVLTLKIRKKAGKPATKVEVAS